MKLHWILKLYFRIFMQILIIKKSLQTFDINSNQHTTHRQEQPGTFLQKPRNSLQRNHCNNENCTKYHEKENFRNIILKRRKRFIVFPQDTAYKATLALSSNLISTTPKGMSIFVEMDGYYPMPDTLEKYYPNPKPLHEHLINHPTKESNSKDPIPPDISKLPEDDTKLKMSELPSNVPLKGSNNDQDMENIDNMNNDYQKNETNSMMPDMMMMNNMSVEEQHNMSDHHDHHNFASWDDTISLKGHNNYWDQPFKSDETFPTPPSYWMNNNDNINGNHKPTKSLPLAHGELKPPPLPQSDNNDTASDDNNNQNGKDDEQFKNFNKAKFLNKKIDAWNDWNNYIPINNYNRYNQNFNQYPSYKFRQPIINYGYNKFKYNIPTNWNVSSSKFNIFQLNEENQNSNNERQSWRRFMNYNNQPTLNTNIQNVRDENYSKEWYYHRGHRERRYVYNEIEKYASNFGFINMKYCIFRTICEVRNYLLPRGMSLLHDIIRVIFTLSYKERWSDDYTEEARSNKTDCKLAFKETCPISILEVLLYSNRNNLKYNLKTA